MSTNEIAVIVFGLFLGYWVVSKLFSGKSQPNSQQQENTNTENCKKEDPTGTQTEWHEVLNVSPHATLEEIRAAYKRLMGQYHPDKVSSLGSELKILAEVKTKEITVAYRKAMQIRGMS